MDVHKENVDSPQPRRGVTFGASRSSRALQARTNKAGPARRAAKPAAREPSVFDIDDDAFADDFKDEMMAGPDEDDSEEETVHGAPESRPHPPASPPTCARDAHGLSVGRREPVLPAVVPAHVGSGLEHGTRHRGRGRPLIS